MPVSNGDRDVAEGNTILRALVGSRVHGTNVAGSDDRDEMGVCVEPRPYVAGLKRFDQWVYRTADEGERSGPNDLDLTIYSLRKFARLAAAGNPSILTLLFVPDDAIVTQAPQGRLLRQAAPMFISREAGHRFLGYLQAQREKLLGLRGNRTNRPELVEAHGYDTKFAAHMVRLGYQGGELLRTGQISLPMPGHIRDLILDIRNGRTTKEEALDIVAVLEAELKSLVGETDWPERADLDAVSDLLVELHESWWSQAAARAYPQLLRTLGGEIG
jgi:uncharacterized protein